MEYLEVDTITGVSKGNPWVPVPVNMPRAVCCHQCVSISNKLYIIGGQESISQTAVYTVNIYDPATKKWSPGPSLLTPRSNFGASAICTIAAKAPWGCAGADSIVVLGGTDANNKQLASGEILPAMPANIPGPPWNCNPLVCNACPYCCTFPNPNEPGILPNGAPCDECVKQKC